MYHQLWKDSLSLQRLLFVAVAKISKPSIFLPRQSTKSEFSWTTSRADWFLLDNLYCYTHVLSMQGVWIWSISWGPFCSARVYLPEMLNHSHSCRKSSSKIGQSSKTTDSSNSGSDVGTGENRDREENEVRDTVSRSQKPGNSKDSEDLPDQGSGDTTPAIESKLGRKGGQRDKGTAPSTPPEAQSSQVSDLPSTAGPLLVQCCTCN